MFLQVCRAAGLYVYSTQCYNIMYMISFTYNIIPLGMSGVEVGVAVVARGPHYVDQPYKQFVFEDKS